MNNRNGGDGFAVGLLDAYFEMIIESTGADDAVTGGELAALNTDDVFERAAVASARLNGATGLTPIECGDDGRKLPIC